MALDRNVYRADLHRRQRAEAVLALGGKCVRCGFDDPRAIQFDHINGGGCAELAANGKGKHPGWPRYYREIAAGLRPDIQLLCANCNWIKRAEENETPKRKRAVAA